MKKIALAFIIITAFISSCQSSEIADSKNVNPETIYTSYSINYTEGDEAVNCNASFRFGGSKGTTLVLSKPSKIELDGENIKVDSSKFSGAFYQTEKAFTSFSGNHTWFFTNTDGSVLKENFVFKPFNLANPIPSIINKKDLTLTFKGLDDGSKVHISISDTSAKTNNIASQFTVQNKQVTIAAAEISQLKAGPLEINIYKQIKKPLLQSTPQGGDLYMSYSLKSRKTILKN